MSEMHLKQPRFNYSASGLFTKTKERIQKFKETGNSRHIYENELEKVCFQHGMAYGDFKDLTKRTAADKVLRDEAFNIAKNSKYDGYQHGVASMVWKCFDKKTSCSGIIQNQELAKESRKPITRKFEKQKVYSSHEDNIWGADLADIQLKNKFNK